MRTIKFRAWDKKKKEFIRGFAITEDGYLMIMWGAGNWEDKAEYGLKNVVLMQFTGLHDKNGKEIYEGDILKWTDKEDNICFNEQVVFAEGAFRSIRETDFKEMKKKYPEEEALLTGYEYFDFEVIGNIYENKELLK